MTRRWLAVLGLIAVFGLAAPTVMKADKDKGRGNAHEFDDEHGRRGDRDDDRWERREGYEYRTYGENEGRPAGWSRGKKTGWGNCGLPPGQAKKYGACRAYTYQGRSHYYYQDERGRIIVRRPSIHVGADVH